MKPIRFKENLKIADRLRKAINRLNTSSQLMKQAHYESFDNCREQGYVLIVYPTTFALNKRLYVAFSENRNSDDIVVYFYQNARFPNNTPATDADWADRHYFRPGNYDEAALFILSRCQRFI